LSKFKKTRDNDETINPIQHKMCIKADIYRKLFLRFLVEKLTKRGNLFIKPALGANSTG